MQPTDEASLHHWIDQSHLIASTYLSPFFKNQYSNRHNNNSRELLSWCGWHSGRSKIRHLIKGLFRLVGVLGVIQPDQTDRQTDKTRKTKKTKSNQYPPQWNQSALICVSWRKKINTRGGSQLFDSWVMAVWLFLCPRKNWEKRTQGFGVLLPSCCCCYFLSFSEFFRSSVFFSSPGSSKGVV